MDNVKKFVTEYIQREYTVPKEQNIMELNYIETGYIDSLGLIQFITSIEDKFSIEFQDEDFENPDIKIVGTLIEMIKRKM